MTALARWWCWLWGHPHPHVRYCEPADWPGYDTPPDQCTNCGELLR